MNNLIKKSLKRAIGVSIGVTFGGYVLPRFIYEYYSPFSLKHAIVYLIINFTVSFFVLLLINVIKTKSK